MQNVEFIMKARRQFANLRNENLREVYVVIASTD